MKKTTIAFVLILLVGCSESMRTTNETSADTLKAVFSQKPASRATVILYTAHDPVGHRTIYEDSNYIFVSRGYGPKGKQVPGLFVFSHKFKKWMEIKKLSTEDVKLGRSPRVEEGLCSVGWDYSNLQTADYATIPLMTSGSLNFPDKILCHEDSAIYLLQFNSSWEIEAVLTQFIVKKKDLDKAFGEEAGNVP